MAAEDNIMVTIEELQKALSANSIIGTPIEMEDRIIVPITKMAWPSEPDRASAQITRKLEEHLGAREAEWAFFR